MSRFDTHVHLWRRGDGHPVRIRDRVAELDQDFDLGRLVPHMRDAGVDRIVLVSAAQTLAEPEYLLSIARRHTDLVAGVIGWADLAAPDFSETLARLAAEPLWLGLRLPIVLEDAAAYARRPGIEAALIRLAATDAVVQVLVNAHQIAHIAPLLERCPELRIVIDHAANPDGSHPPSTEWRDGIRRLAALPNASCKLSSLWMPGAAPPTTEHFKRHMAELVDYFSPQRLVASSNWPVSSLGLMYGDVFDRIERATGLSADILSTNAARIYRRSRRIET